MNTNTNSEIDIGIFDMEEMTPIPFDKDPSQDAEEFRFNYGRYIFMYDPMGTGCTFGPYESYDCARKELQKMIGGFINRLGKDNVKYGEGWADVDDDGMDLELRIVPGGNA